MGPAVRGNPLRIFVFLLVISYFVGEFFIPSYPLFNLLNLIGIMGLILCLALFFSSLNLFNSYKENPTPQSNTKRIIKTGIFAYCRNPMYLALLILQAGIGMILSVIHIIFFTIFTFIVLKYYVIIPEEQYLENKFGNVYLQYKKSVRRWI